jgi:hypothetical protein
MLPQLACVQVIAFPVIDFDSSSVFRDEADTTLTSRASYGKVPPYYGFALDPDCLKSLAPESSVSAPFGSLSFRRWSTVVLEDRKLTDPWRAAWHQSGMISPTSKSELRRGFGISLLKLLSNCTEISAT